MVMALYTSKRMTSALTAIDARRPCSPGDDRQGEVVLELVESQLVVGHNVPPPPFPHRSVTLAPRTMLHNTGRNCGRGCSTRSHGRERPVRTEWLLPVPHTLGGGALHLWGAPHEDFMKHRKRARPQLTGGGAPLTFDALPWGAVTPSQENARLGRTSSGGGAALPRLCPGPARRRLLRSGIPLARRLDSGAGAQLCLWSRWRQRHGVGQRRRRQDLRKPGKHRAKPWLAPSIQRDRPRTRWLSTSDGERGRPRCHRLRSDPWQVASRRQ